MSTRVFLSFVEEDLSLVNLFRGQAKNKNIELEFSDYSVKEPYNSRNADYIRSKIRERINAALVTVCLIGHTTYKSPWVDWELRTSKDVSNRLLGIRLHSNGFLDVTPNALIELKATVVDWNIDTIVKLI